MIALGIPNERFLRKSESKKKPLATLCLLAINVAVFCALPLLFKNEYPSHPEMFGADLGSLTLSGQWWRLLSSQFVHIELFHLAGNMAALWFLGSRLEQAIGSLKFIFVYVLCGVVGDLVVIANDPHAVSFGASAGVAGAAGGVLCVCGAQAGAVWRRSRLKFALLIALPLYVVWIDSSYRSYELHTFAMAMGIIITAPFVYLRGGKRSESLGGSSLS